MGIPKASISPSQRLVKLELKPIILDTYSWPRATSGTCKNGARRITRPLIMALFYNCSVADSNSVKGLQFFGLSTFSFFFRQTKIKSLPKIVKIKFDCSEILNILVQTLIRVILMRNFNQLLHS